MAWEYDGGLGLRGLVGLVGLWFRPGTGDWAFLRGDAPVSFLPTAAAFGCLGGGGLVVLRLLGLAGLAGLAVLRLLGLAGGLATLRLLGLAGCLGVVGFA